uniref:cytidine deaminase n=1 Tax=Desulfobacca sp. TaxID=2067990 RepID=UPI00404A0FEE
MDNDDVMLQTLLQGALRARERAYAPYSRFPVGAAVLTAEGQVFSGANVENTSLGATLCAERVAIGSAVAAGCRVIKALAVVADTPAPVAPCGLCRQVLQEFAAPDCLVIMANLQGAYQVVKHTELLPMAFVWPAAAEQG